MMHEFLSAHRDRLIALCQDKVAERAAPKATALELVHGIPMFLDQLIKTLRIEQGVEPMRSRRVSGITGGVNAVTSELGEAAAQHGRELLEGGSTVEQVVHDYGDLCQAITDLAFELNEPIDIDEFRTLNRCLDNGIAVAVTEFNYQRDFVVAEKSAEMVNERLGFFAHELRNLLNSATLALTAIKTGDIGVNGATGAVLDRSLVGLRNLIDRSLSEVRMTAGMPVYNRLFSLSDFIAEIKVSASLEAQVKECGLQVADVDPRLAIDADRDLLSSAVGNLLQNAFKFTHPRSEVTLNAFAIADRIHIEVADCCGGLPAGDGEKMFEPFTQADEEDRSGLGLGLAISRRSVAANNGTLSVRDMPGEGCVFTIDLPRHSLAELSSNAAPIFAAPRL
ncbi:MAG: HAMP domain-containing histidine kinase [Verrucomicrobiota bacterium]|nr:HAMP domain-containing histidine kinase [Verrucomicrobiota bacterium]